MMAEGLRMKKARGTEPPGTKSPDQPIQSSCLSLQPEVWRVFCAVEIPEEVSRLMAEHMKKLKARFPTVPASWSREGKFHLTLKFLGNVLRNRVEDVSRAASLTTDCVAPIPIKVGGTGTFPKHGPPRVLWIGIDDWQGKLTKLQRDLEGACAPLGFPGEERPFHPHLTIARLRKPQGAKELGWAHRDMEFEPVEITVPELIVLRSELGSDGSKYNAISRHQLKGNACC